MASAYWYPLYAYARRRGFGPEDAEDLTQEFFHQLLASDWIARADRSKGRFRTFLLCAYKTSLAMNGSAPTDLSEAVDTKSFPSMG